MGRHVAVISADTSLVKPKLDFATVCIGSLLLSRAKEQVRRIRWHDQQGASRSRL
jgi:hypothetical protein